MIPTPKGELNGTGKQKCSHGVICPYTSIPGLRRGQGKCPYHWALLVWGPAWADACYPNHPQAQARLAKEKR